MKLQDRTNRSVDFRVHQHQVLAVADRFHRDMGGGFHGARDLDDGIDAVGAAQ